MCNECQGKFCKNCIEELGKDNHKCESPVYVEDANAKAFQGHLNIYVKIAKVK